MFESLRDFGLLAFASLFTIIDPLGLLPVYLSMTSGLTQRQSRFVAVQATATAFVVLLGFALAGQFIFDFFRISANSLRIVGGIIFFLMGYEMLQARLSRTRLDEETVREFIADVAITPLGIPLIAGPGAITTVILFMSESQTVLQKGALILALMAVLALTLLLLVTAKPIVRFLGPNGEKVIMRIMGLIVMAFAVEFFFAGLTPVVQEMLRGAN